MIGVVGEQDWLLLEPDGKGDRATASQEQEHPAVRADLQRVGKAGLQRLLETCRETDPGSQGPTALELAVLRCLLSSISVFL